MYLVLLLHRHVLYLFWELVNIWLYPLRRSFLLCPWSQRDDLLIPIIHKMLLTCYIKLQQTFTAQLYNKHKMVFCVRVFSVKYKTRTHTTSTFHTARSQLTRPVSVTNFCNTQTSQVSDVTDNPISSSNLRVFTVAELKTATDNFCRSSKIGEGGFGKVYKGVVKSLDYPFRDIPVAVKYGDGLLQASFISKDDIFEIL